jgi:hypothetical protein
VDGEIVRANRGERGAHGRSTSIAQERLWRSCPTWCLVDRIRNLTLLESRTGPVIALASVMVIAWGHQSYSKENLMTDRKTKAYAAYREHIGPEKLDAFNKKYNWMEKGQYVAHSAPKSMMRPTRLVPMRRDRVAFLAEQLSVKPPGPKRRRRHSGVGSTALPKAWPVGVRSAAPRSPRGRRTMHLNGSLTRYAKYIFRQVHNPSVGFTI